MNDYYIRLIIPITFTLLKIYLDGYPEYDTIKNKRDIRFKDIGPGDLSPNISKVNYFNSRY